MLPLHVVVEYAKQDYHAVDQDAPIHVCCVWRWCGWEEQKQERDAQETDGDDVDEDSDSPGNLKA